MNIIPRLSARHLFLVFLLPMLFSCSDSNDDQLSYMDMDADGIPDDLDQCNNTPDGVQVDEKGCIVYIYLADGATSWRGSSFGNDRVIKAYEYAQAGDTGVIGGVTYTVVDEAMLREMITKGEEVSKVCTTRVTDMSELFSGAENFNEPIGNWDVSNVTDMTGMFRDATSFNQSLDNWVVENVRSCDGFNDNTPKWLLPKPRFRNCSPQGF